MNFILTTIHSNNYEYYKNRLQYFLFEYKPESVNLENILWSVVLVSLILLIIFCPIFNPFVDDDC